MAVTGIGIGFGCVVPHRILSAKPELASTYFQSIEALGADYVTSFDHVGGAPRDRLAHLAFAPYTYEDPFQEILVTLAFGAACTSSLELATGILVLPQRQVVLAAKQLASLDSLSGGRLRVGLGVGWNPAEFRMLGAPFDRRGELFNEQLAILRRLWTEQLVEVDGSFHKWDSAGLAPLPPRRIPVWIGGGSERSVERAVRFADGWIPSRADARSGRKPDLDGLLGYLRSLLQAAERPPETFGIEGRVVYSDDIDQVAADFEWWRTRGADKVALIPPSGIGVQLDQHLEAIEIVTERLAHAYG